MIYDGYIHSSHHHLIKDNTRHIPRHSILNFINIINIILKNNTIINIIKSSSTLISKLQISSNLRFQVASGAHIYHIYYQSRWLLVLIDGCLYIYSELDPESPARGTDDRMMEKRVDNADISMLFFS